LVALSKCEQFYNWMPQINDFIILNARRVIKTFFSPQLIIMIVYSFPLANSWTDLLGKSKMKSEIKAVSQTCNSRFFSFYFCFFSLQIIMKFVFEIFFVCGFGCGVFGSGSSCYKNQHDLKGLRVRWAEAPAIIYLTLWKG